MKVIRRHVPFRKCFLIVTRIWVFQQYFQYLKILSSAAKEIYLWNLLNRMSLLFKAKIDIKETYRSSANRGCAWRNLWVDQGLEPFGSGCVERLHHRMVSPLLRGNNRHAHAFPWPNKPDCTSLEHRHRCLNICGPEAPEKYHLHRRLPIGCETWSRDSFHAPVVNALGWTVSRIVLVHT